MPSGMVLYALMIVIALAALELLKLLVRKGFSKISTAVTEENFRQIQVKMRDTYKEQVLIRGEFEELKLEVSKVISEEEFNKFKSKCEDCQKVLPEKYVLYSRYKEDLDRVEKNNKEGLEKIWRKVDELLKLYYED